MPTFNEDRVYWTLVCACGSDESETTQKCVYFWGPLEKTQVRISGGLKGEEVWSCTWPKLQTSLGWLLNRYEWAGFYCRISVRRMLLSLHTNAWAFGMLDKWPAPSQMIPYPTSSGRHPMSFNYGWIASAFVASALQPRQFFINPSPIEIFNTIYDNGYRNNVMVSYENWNRNSRCNHY